METINADLRAEIRAGRARPEQKLAVCSGGVSLSPEDRVELLAVLAGDKDASVAERAQNVLLTQSLEHFRAALARADADPRFFSYCSGSLADKPGIADALAKNQACPTASVTPAVRHLTTEGIQSLLDNLERFVSDPHLVAAVQNSPAASAEQLELLKEMQKGALERKEIEEALTEVEPDPAKRETLMQRLAQMTVLERLMLALKGGRSERMMLIRDPNKLVQRSVLQSPRLTDSEVELFAAMTNLSIDVLRIISTMRVFMKNYSIVKNLVSNPKTPLDISLHLFPRLNATDLVKLTTNKNVPETLRSTAVKLHRRRKTGVG
jgi:hypothetical protein